MVDVMNNKKQKMLLIAFVAVTLITVILFIWHQGLFSFSSGNDYEDYTVEQTSGLNQDIVNESIMETLNNPHFMQLVPRGRQIQIMESEKGRANPFDIRRNGSSYIAPDIDNSTTTN